MQTLPVCWALSLNLVQTGSEKVGEGQWPKKGWEKGKVAQGKNSRGRVQNKQVPWPLWSGTLPLLRCLIQNLDFPWALKVTAVPDSPNTKESGNATPSLSLRKDYPACLSLITPCKWPYGDNLWQVNNRSYLDYSSCKYLPWLCADSSWIETMSFHFRSWSNFQCN